MKASARSSVKWLKDYKMITVEKFRGIARILTIPH
jgi:hypothetical protein